MCDLNHGHKYKMFVMIFFLNKNYFLKFMKLSFFYRCDARHPPIGVGTR